MGVYNNASIDGEEVGKTPLRNIVVLKFREHRFLRRQVVAYLHVFTLSMNIFKFLSKIMGRLVAIFTTFERLEIDLKLLFYGPVTPKQNNNLMILKESVKIYYICQKSLYTYQ